MERDPENKIVVVTGGAGGLGFAIANQFLLNGAKTSVILDVNEEKGNEAASNLNKIYGEDKAYFIKCDVTTDLDEVSKEIFDKFGSVDVLVNNAGVSNYDWDVEIDINLRAVVKWSFKFWEIMRRDKGGNGGTIMNMSSLYGFLIDPYFPVYHATKFGVIGLSKSLGHELNFNRSGVRVVTLCPGFTRTNLGAGQEKRTFDDEALLKPFNDALEKVVWQDAEVVGAAAVNVFRRADSGTVWIINEGKLEEKAK